MSDDVQKLRLKPRATAGAPVSSALRTEPGPAGGAVEHSNRPSVTEPERVAPPPLQPNLEAGSESANVSPKTPGDFRGANPPPIATPPPPAVRRAQRAVLVLGSLIILLFVGAGLLAYRLIVRPPVADYSESVLGAFKNPAPSLFSSQEPAPAEPTIIASERATAPPVGPVPASELAPSPSLHLPGEDAGAAFRSWVDNVKISGVRVGSNPRILVGKVSFNRGDVVDEKLGIVFVGYDQDRRMVRFQDSSGAILERSDRVIVPANAPPSAASRQPGR